MLRMKKQSLVFFSNGKNKEICYLNNHLVDNLFDNYRFKKKIDIDTKTKIIEIKKNII